MSIKNPWLEKEVCYEATAVQIDSLAAKTLALNKHVCARNKHIDLKYYFEKAALASGIMQLVDMNSENNPPDMLTKIIDLSTVLLLSHRLKTGIHCTAISALCHMSRR